MTKEDETINTIHAKQLNRVFDELIKSICRVPSCKLKVTAGTGHLLCQGHLRDFAEDMEGRNTQL